MNKVVVVAIAVGLGFVTLPSHAISDKHRQALIWSGCNMQTESDGTCDIHKPAAYNKRMAERSVDNSLPDRDLIEDFGGVNILDAADVMLRHGWKPVNGWWYKNGHKVFFNVAADKTIASTVIK